MHPRQTVDRFAKLALIALTSACSGAEPQRVEGLVHTPADGRAMPDGDDLVGIPHLVEAHRIDAGGQLIFVEEAPVRQRGTYVVDVDSRDAFVLVEALDRRGALVGSVVVPPTSGPTRQAPPIDVERSVEAEVFLAAGAEPALYERVRARVDAVAAAQIAGAVDTVHEVAALAESLRGCAPPVALASTWPFCGDSIALYATVQGI